MKIAVTGSSGFIGRYVVDSLQKIGHELKLLDLSIGIDICDWNQIKHLTGIDVFIHLANKTFVPDSYKEPRSFYETNIISTLNVLELCRINKSKILFLSSYVYGHPVYQPIDEKHPVQPFNPYAQSKVICEQIIYGYNRDFSVPAIVLRPFNIYGAGQNENFLIPSIIKQARSGGIVVKDERPKRDFLHINDLVDAIKLAVNYTPPNEVELLNVASGKSFSVKEVVNYIMQHMDTSVEYICTNEFRQNEVLDTVAEISKIKSRLNWAPKINLEQGLQQMILENIA